MEIAGHIKLAIMVIGMSATLIYLIPGLKKNDNLKKTRAGLLFVITCIAIMIVSVIEFAIFYKL